MASAPQGRLGRNREEETHSQGAVGGGLIRGSRKLKRCGGVGRVRTGPQGEGEVLYWKGEAEVRRGSVGLVKGQAELSSPGDGAPPYAGPWRRYEVKMDLELQYTESRAGKSE